MGGGVLVKSHQPKTGFTVVKIVRGLCQVVSDQMIWQAYLGNACTCTVKPGLGDTPLYLTICLHMTG